MTNARQPTYEQLSGEAKRVLWILSTGTVHKLALPERATRELTRIGLAHESQDRIRTLWNPAATKRSDQ